MSIFNSEQAKLNACKEELKDKSNLELEDISKGNVKTSLLFSSGKNKLYQVAAFQLLRERNI